MNWSGITEKIASIQEKINANEREKFTLRNQLDRARKLVGCTHPVRHHYLVADQAQRLGCSECDREEADRGRGCGLD